MPVPSRPMPPAPMLRELPPTAGLPAMAADFWPPHGPAAFGPAVAEFLGVDEAIITPSGSAALVIALEHLKTRSPARLVIVPAYTCPLVVLAARQAGCRVVACDTLPGRFDMDTAHLARLLGPEVLCVVPTHYGGALTDVAAVRAVVTGRTPQVAIVEDAAQAFGATVAGQAVGTAGDIGFHSFALGKGLTLCEGGCLVARSEADRQGLRQMAARLLQPGRLTEALRILALLAYAAGYSPAGLRVSYGPLRRHLLRRGRIAAAIGDHSTGTVAMNRVSVFRQRAGLRALARLPAHLAAVAVRHAWLADTLHKTGGSLTPYPTGDRPPSGTFLFAQAAAPAELEKLLAVAWPSPFGVTKLFAGALSAYPALGDTLLPSPTPNAERLAATTLTITTSPMATEADMAGLLRLLGLLES